MRRLAIFLSTAGYIGYFPIAPGTVGSAAGLVIYAVERALARPALELAVVVALFVAGAWAGTHAEAYFGREDPGQVVLDEVMGMLITLAFVPVSVTGAVIGFVLFRIFDVVKPWPANRLERLGGGLGIMSDDAMAAIYAHIALRGMAWLAPAWVL